MIKGGISQIGGKFRLYKELLKRTPYHEFFLSPFCGAAWFELNKPRCRYECFNDYNSELINYFIQVRKYPKEFDEMKQGIFGLVSQEICNQIIRGDISPENELERAYFFYYLNKLTFGGSVQKGFTGLVDQKNQGSRIDIDKIKANWKGMFPTQKNITKDNNIEKAKANYRGLVGMGVVTEINRDLVKKEKNASYKGMLPPNKKTIETSDVISEKRARKFEINPNASYKGISPKTTRPFSNNDMGLLSPLDPECIKRLRYVNLTSYDFRKVYNLFYKAFHERKGLGPECFLYFDPPYCGTEKYYHSGYGDEEHLDLIELLIKSPFHCLLSMGGNCEIYIDILREEGWIIDIVNTKYSTDANSQNTVQEYLCMNYNLNKLPIMIESIEQTNLFNYMNKKPEMVY